MTLPEARAVLELAREASWTYPTSSGRPVPREAPAWVRPLMDARGRIAAAARCLTEAGHLDEAVELAARAWRVWIMARAVDEDWGYLVGMLKAAPPSRWRALALYGMGLLAFWGGDRSASRARSEAALADALLFPGDPEVQTLAHLGVARAAASELDAAQAMEFALKAREFARGLPEAYGQAPLHMHAQARLLARDFDAAAALFADSLELNRRIGDEGMVVVELHNLGHVHVRRGDADAAERLFEECERLGDGTGISRAFADLNRACVAFARGEVGRARGLLEGAEQGLRDAGMDPSAESEAAWLRERLAGM